MSLLLLKETSSFKLGVWKIEEEAAFFSTPISYQANATHPGRSLQQLATRFLITYLEPNFPIHHISLGEAGKPELISKQFEFNLSHTAQMAAVVVSNDFPVGIDIEKINPRALRIKNKFLHADEIQSLSGLDEQSLISRLTLYWSIKETVYKWWGKGGIDFARDIKIEVKKEFDSAVQTVQFGKVEGGSLEVICLQVEDHWLTYLVK
jgi:phosphopantetheine--protein transferase-like protein